MIEFYCVNYSGRPSLYNELGKKIRSVVPNCISDNRRWLWMEWKHKKNRRPRTRLFTPVHCWYPRSRLSSRMISCIYIRLILKICLFQAHCWLFNPQAFSALIVMESIPVKKSPTTIIEYIHWIYYVYCYSFGLNMLNSWERKSFSKYRTTILLFLQLVYFSVSDMCNCVMCMLLKAASWLTNPM